MKRKACTSSGNDDDEGKEEVADYGEGEGEGNAK